MISLLRACACVCALLCVCARAGASAPERVDDRFLQALAWVESRGNPSAVGDQGKAIGIYQIHRSYWADAVEHDKSIGGRYEDCYDPAYARRIVVAYMSRYAPANATYEQLARLHNGGCSILKRKGTKAWHNTTAYWHKIRAAMER
jgi:soluble lytic murein transglycosylase-like protein